MTGHRTGENHGGLHREAWPNRLSTDGGIPYPSTAARLRRDLAGAR